MKTRVIKDIIDYAAKMLCAKYREVNNWQQLFYNVLLGEKVRGGDLLVGGDPMSESYRSLVTRGVLMDSFVSEHSHFIPTVPELYLHRWVGNIELDKKVRTLLSQILETRYEYTSVKFEIIHSSCEQMMRKIRNGAAPSASCLVDGRSILRGIEYIKGTKITSQPNTIYNPVDDQNKGWDRLIVLEAFRVSPGSNTSERYLLPLFIQNKFSKDSSTTMLDVGVVNTAYDHCKVFINSSVTLDSEFSPFATTGDNFVLLFITKCNKNKNVFTDSPSNVMFCFGEDLEALYGPTLKGFVSTLQPGHSISVRAPE